MGSIFTFIVGMIWIIVAIEEIPSRYIVDITIFIVINNGIYGTIRMHQERRFPDRVSGTDIVNPDFPAICEAYGGKGYLVTETDAFRPALEDALANDRMALIEIRIDPDDIAPGRKLSAL